MSKEKQHAAQVAARNFIINNLPAYDSHTHIHDPEFQADYHSVIARAHAANIKQMLLPCDDLQSCKRTLSFYASLSAQEKKLVRYALGYHPHAAEDYCLNNGYAELVKLAGEFSLVARTSSDNSADRFVSDSGKPILAAVGEIGLDYYYDNSPRALQKRAFYEQLAWAAELKLPLSIHTREAFSDTLDILQSAFKNNLLLSSPGVIHCYSGSKEFAKRLLEMGFYLGFDGPITFKNARVAPEVIEYCPLSRILIETDAPYLTPEPFRGERNEPANVKLVLQKIAEIKNVAPEEVARVIYDNAVRLFGIN